MWRNSAALALFALAACDTSVGNRTERSGEVKVSGVEQVGNNSSAPLEGVGAPMAWRVRDGAAFYGSADQPPQFALRCDRAAEQIVLERAGGEAGLTIMAGDAGGSYAARPAKGGRIQARVPLGDPLLEAMSRSQSQIQTGGVTVPGGVAVRRVVDWCRTPPEPEPTAPPENAIEPTPEPAPSPSL